ncbi:hypothetical protein QUG_1627 [Clostridioides difficile P53]|nr:hypothetical protein QUA_1754 [Clostridioides difficile P49]ERM48264.1 hypothetical protein QUG_1627 [Clostridioides difficile P53]
MKEIETFTYHLVNIKLDNAFALSDKINEFTYHLVNIKLGMMKDMDNRGKIIYIPLS